MTNLARMKASAVAQGSRRPCYWRDRLQAKASDTAEKKFFGALAVKTFKTFEDAKKEVHR